LYGGEPIAKQLEALRRGAHIVVGTPGRVLDHLGRGTLRLDWLQTVVLDEADRMLDIGFEEDINRILQHTPPERQTVLFAATMPSPIRNLVKRYLSNPQWILVGAESEPVVEVEQTYYEVASADKLKGLHELLKAYKDGQTLIFCRTRSRVDRLVGSLLRLGYEALAIHGGMRQNQRNTAMNAFRNGRLKLLVATDVASRGIDIPEISYIINYDIPQTLEEYVHRIGRTGRMGRHGTAATFVSEWELDDFKPIRSRVGNKLQQRKLAIYA
ncbi:MAG: DEAD/DEAH box helicase, partial [Chloroflexi bacterium]|nr:DEAD/DEAH box helicase [Chloroflexota bacterium]